MAFMSKSIDEDGGMWGNGKSSFLQEPQPNPFLVGTIDEAFKKMAIFTLGKSCKMEKVFKRNRILITLQFVQNIIDISIIPDSSPSELTSTTIALVQGYILKKMLKEYLSQLNKEEKPQSQLELGLRMLLISLKLLPYFCVCLQP
jgi:hypothetical protein